MVLVSRNENHWQLPSPEKECVGRSLCYSLSLYNFLCSNETGDLLPDRVLDGWLNHLRSRSRLKSFSGRVAERGFCFGFFQLLLISSTRRNKHLSSDVLADGHLTDRLTDRQKDRLASRTHLIALISGWIDGLNKGRVVKAREDSLTPSHPWSHNLHPIVLMWVSQGYGT